MFIKKIISSEKIILCSAFFVTLNLFSGCITSARQDALQNSIDKLQNQITKLENQVNSKDQQINSTTQTILASQNEAQSVKDQLQLTQGAVDELKNRLKKVEENAGSSNVVSVNTDSDTVVSMQKQIARLQLATSSRFSYTRKGKLTPKLKNLAEINKILKASLDAGNFKGTIDTATTVLLAHEATDEMLAAALEFRGEARFQMQDYRGAASDLAGVTEVFVHAPRKARALLLTGDSYVYLKNNAIALLYYQDCVKEFANAPEGKAAAGRLANLTAQMSSSTKSSPAPN